MNSVGLRKYWDYKYQSVFGEYYAPSNRNLELILFKRLLEQHNEFVILEAIDIFLKRDARNVASVRYFACKKVFDSKFKDLIKCSDVIKYRRFLNTYPKELQDKVRPLITEYQDYCNWETISDDEKIRKSEIVKILMREIDGVSSKRN
jgi:hypothetical protein